MSNSRSDLSSVSTCQLGVLLTAELDVVSCTTTNRRDDSDNLFCRVLLEGVVLSNTVKK